jgi:branched-chain amino acid transport system permease protein
MSKQTPLQQLAQIQTPVVLVLTLLLVQIISGAVGGTVLNRIVTLMFIQVVLVVSLQMFMGNSGVVSFAHIGFMGIGAFMSIIFTLPDTIKGRTLPNLYPIFAEIALPFLPALIVAGVVAALFAALFGFPLMRLSGAASVIATFALLVIVHVILLNWNEMTNGPRTVFGVQSLTDSWTAVGWTVATVILAYLFKESRIGLMLRASREDEKAAASIGIDIILLRWAAFIIGAFFAGIAGGLYAHFILSFNADAFFLDVTFLILAMLIIGGTGSVSGAVVGVLLVTLLSEGIRSVENQINIAQIIPGGIAGATEVIVSIIMILVLILRPSGLTGGREIGLPARRNTDPKRMETAGHDA